MRVEQIAHAVTWLLWLLRRARVTGLSLAPRMILASCQEGPVVVVRPKPGMLHRSCHRNNTNVFSPAR